MKIETIPSEQSIASAVEANTVQLGLLTEPQVATHLPSSIKVQKVLDLTYRALMLQDKTGPLANVDNRLAIACAVNRKQVLEEAVFGAGQVVGPVPLGHYASNPVSAVCPTPRTSPWPRATCRKRVTRSGFSFTALTSTDLDPTSAAQATVVQSDLAKVGIKMNIQNLAGDAYIQDWLKGNFQAAFAWNGADPNPYTMYGRYFGTGANLGVPAGYSSPALAEASRPGRHGDRRRRPEGHLDAVLQCADVQRGVDLALHRLRLRSARLRRPRVLAGPDELDLARLAALDHFLASRPSDGPELHSAKEGPRRLLASR